ncbi:unnamed protein product, partial [Symbiodinium sp. CCMP2456]
GSFLRDFWQLLLKRLGSTRSEDLTVTTSSLLRVLVDPEATLIFQDHEVLYMLRIFERMQTFRRSLGLVENALPLCHYLAGLALVSGMTKREKLTLIFEAFDSDYDHCLLYSQVHEMCHCICVLKVMVEESALVRGTGGTATAAEEHFQAELSQQEGLRWYESVRWHLQRSGSVQGDIVSLPELFEALDTQPGLLLMPGVARIRWAAEAAPGEDLEAAVRAAAAELRQALQTVHPHGEQGIPSSTEATQDTDRYRTRPARRPSWRSRPSSDAETYNIQGLPKALPDQQEEQYYDQALFKQNENEYHTQSYTGPEEEEYPKEEEKPPKESDEDIKARVKRVDQEIRMKTAMSKEREMNFVYPTDMSQEFKHHTENGHIWRESHNTGEMEWYDYDYAYAHEKGKGQEEYAKKGGKGKNNEKRSGFVPKDEEDAKYWERVGEQEEEKRKKREQEKMEKEDEERQKLHYKYMYRDSTGTLSIKMGGSKTALPCGPEQPRLRLTVSEAGASANASDCTMDRSSQLQLPTAVPTPSEERQYYWSSNRSSGFRAPPRPRDDSGMTCLACGKIGHRASNCPNPPKASANVIQEEAPFVMYADAMEEHAAMYLENVDEETAWSEQTVQSTAEAVDQGKCVIDSGATKSLGSIYVIRWTGTRARPARADANPRVETADKDLLSIDALRKMGAQIDFANDLMILSKLSRHKVIRLERSSTGHQILSLDQVELLQRIEELTGKNAEEEGGALQIKREAMFRVYDRATPDPTDAVGFEVQQLDLRGVEETDEAEMDWRSFEKGPHCGKHSESYIFKTVLTERFAKSLRELGTLRLVQGRELGLIYSKAWEPV